MPHLISTVDVRPRVSYRTIQIGPILFEETPAEDDVVQIPGDGWSLTSSDNDFYPLVRLETWDGPAPKPTGAWNYERAFRSRMADRLAVVDLNGVDYGEIALRPGRYHLRLLCRGRDHLEAPLALDPFPPDGPHEDPLEVWVVQMWPDR
ncbi:hypothetical protein [Streptomyces resistomycificus]|uniref:Uncharacterized protein n=1 Tax=Streptomyces resistomycificus TaxID=67356 RepID=A0A0L8LGA6_9ACTN|nr:hypothetical protein [Streptomyces resistomycificus]KOG37145.1 hypothetical protein ADK37_12080 [Streptomyces resistomycificus]KUN95096.1 hypothetical protein AQJ84_23800 [Streptomyces resistomycificus]